MKLQEMVLNMFVCNLSLFLSLSLSLCCKVPTINSREYVHWREIGVAFQLRDDAPYENSNCTLANGAIIQSGGGTSVARRGYWGDIVNSPYIVFGTSCNSEDMLKKVNDKYVKVRDTYRIKKDLMSWNQRWASGLST